MNWKPAIWVWTPAFAEVAAELGLVPPESVQLVQFAPDESKVMLLTFRLYHRTSPHTPMIIFDLARFRDDRKQAYVRDGIGRMGTNPLRGLGPLLREPFIDVSRLYHLPAGEDGVIAVSIGSRFRSHEYDPTAIQSNYPVCSFLQSAAILAHSEGFNVTGVLVSELYFRDVDVEQLLVGLD
jgi:hypothetical protein